MTYRPDGWKNPYDYGCAKDEVFDVREMLKRHKKEVYEKGADDILEGLRKTGHHVDGAAEFTSVREHVTLRNREIAGTYVFIPDDETLPAGARESKETGAGEINKSDN